MRNQYLSDDKKAKVSFVPPSLTGNDYKSILECIERIAYEIAQEGETDGLREVDAG
jgi:hypothetical protein